MDAALPYHIRTYTSADGPAVVTTQTAYAQCYPGETVIPAAVYGMPAFADRACNFCETHTYVLPLQSLAV